MSSSTDNPRTIPDIVKAKLAAYNDVTELSELFMTLIQSTVVTTQGQKDVLDLINREMEQGRMRWDEQRTKVSSEISNLYNGPSEISIRKKHSHDIHNMMVDSMYWMEKTSAFPSRLAVAKDLSNLGEILMSDIIDELKLESQVSDRSRKAFMIEDGLYRAIDKLLIKTKNDGIGLTNELFKENDPSAVMNLIERHQNMNYDSQASNGVIAYVMENMTEALSSVGERCSAM